MSRDCVFFSSLSSCSFGGGNEFLPLSTSINFFYRAQVQFSDYKAAMKEIRPSEVNCSLWNQEFGSGLFKEIGKSELVYGHFY
jgi:hypothetical protein